MATSKTLKRSWLRDKHPIFGEWEEIWRQNERRLRGGTEVLVELRRFDWEKANVKNDEAYRSRQADATYVPFPDLHASIVTGHLLREAPGVDNGIDFGTLGRIDSEGVTPDQAKLIYYNVDGTGLEGAQWDPWWMAKLKLAMATGHRWMYVEATTVAPRTAADEMAGARPYLIEFSPLSVPNWDFEENGRLNFAVVKFRRRVVKINNQTRQFEEGGRYKDAFMLLVREGYDALDGDGDEFKGGGWWKFDHELEFLKENGQPVHSNWDSTGGEIPMFPFFAERDDGSVEKAAMSRPMLTSLGQVAISYMNLSSAADYDAWDAGQSINYILGIPAEQHSEVIAQARDGSKLIGVPLTMDAEGNVHLPSLVDGSQGAVSSGVWSARLQNKWEEARVLAAMEATGDPSTSGVSKQISFQHIMSPKLAHVASNIEAAQREAIRLFELRFSGGNKQPTGSVTWPRQFQLKNIIEDINAIFNMEALTGYKNPEFGAELMGKAIEELALVTDPEEREKIVAGYKESAKRAEEMAQAERDRLLETPPPGTGGNNPFGDDEE